MEPLSTGQFVKHAQYGLGTVTRSDGDRTSIDFSLHGPKKFATQQMTVELTHELPQNKRALAKGNRVATESQVIGQITTEKDCWLITWRSGGLYPCDGHGKIADERRVCAVPPVVWEISLRDTLMAK